MTLTIGQFLLAVIAVLLAVITGLIAYLAKSFSGQIHDSNSIIAAIQTQAGKDRQNTAVIAERLSNHLEATELHRQSRR